MGEDISFETGLERLSRIVEKLENEEVSLEESVEKFEEGMEISKKCAKILEEAEMRIKKVTRGEGGKLVETEIDVEK